MGKKAKPSPLPGRRSGKDSRRAGRPRANPRKLTRSPEEEILVVAGKLFKRMGFHATSTRQIAAAAGLRQPSLFHYYPNKDAILGELIRFSIERPLAFAERIANEKGPASVRLYRLIRYDVHHICASPYELAVLLEIWENRKKQFRPWFVKHAKLMAIIERLVRRGQVEGDVEMMDPVATTNLLIWIDAATVYWYPRNFRQSPVEVAEQVATFALRALLRDASDLTKVRRAAGPFGEGDRS